MYRNNIALFLFNKYTLVLHHYYLPFAYVVTYLKDDEDTEVVDISSGTFRRIVFAFSDCKNRIKCIGYVVRQNNAQYTILLCDVSRR